MLKEDYFLSKADEADAREIEMLSLKNGGNKKLTKEFILHWYFENPSGSFAIWKVVVNNKIEGFATTNNFKFIINSNSVNVAMPQNVLTSEKIRGKGLFNKLYFKTEHQNIYENNVEAFLTFTNELSTSIFLKKFNYIKGKCPIVIFHTLSPTYFFKKKNFQQLYSIDDIEAVFLEKKFVLNNSMQKDKQYYKWRYSHYAENELHILKVVDEDNVIGYAILKVEKKKGLRFLIIMDMIFIDPDYIVNIIHSCLSFSAKKLYAGTMMFELPFCKALKDILQFNIRSRFNFLVKGKDADHSPTLSAVDFNMFFGDMDIV